MYDKEFRVKLISSKNSFIFLSEPDSRHLDHEHMIRLSYGLNKRAYFSFGTALSSLKEGELGLCTILAKELGIAKSDVVSLSTTPYIANIRRLKLLTSSQDDYDMLVELAETVQNKLLNQVKIVHNQQKLVIWISNSLHVTVSVEGVEPMSPGKLEMLTEVAVLPPPSPPIADVTCAARKVGARQAYDRTRCAMRLHPIAAVLPAIADKAAAQQPFSVLLSHRHFERLVAAHRHYRDAPVALVTLRIVSPPSDGIDGGGAGDALTARLLPLDDALLPPDALFAHAAIFAHFRALAGARVLVEMAPLPRIPFVPKCIEIITTAAFRARADELVRDHLRQQCVAGGGRTLINVGVVLEEVVERCRFELRFQPANARHLLVDERLLRTLRFNVLDVELVDVPFVGDASTFTSTVPPLLSIANYAEIVETSVDCLLRRKTTVVLTGNRGAGKTRLAEHIVERLRAPPAHVHIERLDCRRLKGKSVESLLKLVNFAFLRLVYYQPSVLLFDDLHVLCAKIVDAGEGQQPPTPDSVHINRVSALLGEEITNLLRNNRRIALLATAESLASLNQHVHASRGRHLFKHRLAIDELSSEDRMALLEHLFAQKDAACAGEDARRLATATDGYVVQDLADLVDRVVFEAYKSGASMQPSLAITATHCEVALRGASSLALRNVRLHAPGERNFDDVGGLDDVKRVLIEAMLWPAQYAKLFAHAPLRLQSGVLLYGPPGTGKTMLATAAAAQCHLRLIAIKGPELLSKYIGASEQAVRDIFQKARSARPCILFFDEFDSLAPRRGHDSTGVTDRVVNQLLTQLDGVEEGVRGVCVLAATSRPDLLDPALLRPGRLDRALLCALPDEPARLRILEAHARHLPLDDDVQLSALAARTDGFTGADLQAAVYTAQVNVVIEAQHAQANTPAADDAVARPLITQRHLDDAVRTTRPSLTRDELAKYERIYRRFQGTSSDTAPFHHAAGAQRATLA